jgi:hypothetical protein
MDSTPRSVYTELPDAQLLGQCAVDTYRASGPGGQKRNKTSSAVRIRHAPTGFLVIAEESRSQHENKAKALERLRHAFCVDYREPLTAEQLTPEALAVRPEWGDTIHTRRKDARYWPAFGLVLDVLHAQTARVSETAAALGVSTGQLIDYLQQEPQVWQRANEMRAEFGHKPLR